MIPPVLMSGHSRGVSLSAARERVGEQKKWCASTTLSMLRHTVQTHYLFKVNPVRLYLAYWENGNTLVAVPTGYTGHALLVT